MDQKLNCDASRTPVTVVQGNLRIAKFANFVQRADKVVALLLPIPIGKIALKFSGALESGFPVISVSSVKQGAAVSGDEPTVISFPEFPGWHVHAAEITRANISLCIVRTSKR